MINLSTYQDCFLPFCRGSETLVESLHKLALSHLLVTFALARGTEMIAQYIKEQEEEILRAIEVAADGGSTTTMHRLYHQLRLTLEFLDKHVESKALDMVAAGYLPTFARSNPDMFSSSEAALRALNSALPVEYRPQVDRLKGILGDFIFMWERQPRQAKLFGLIICRMHPETLPLAEKATAQKK